MHSEPASKLPVAACLRKARRRVVIILEATAGGTRRHVNTLLDKISRKDFEPILYCSTGRDKNFLNDIRRFHKNSIKVRIFPMKREISPLSDMWCLLKTTLALRSDKPDIVHTHSSKAGFIGRLAAKFASCHAVVHTPHVFPFEMEVSCLQRFLYTSLERTAARWTSLLLAVCESEKLAAIQTCKFPEERVKVVHNSIDPDKWRENKTKRVKIRRLNGFAKKNFVVGMIARLDVQKGCFLFLEAAKIILAEDKSFRFVIAGSGPLGEAAEKFVSENSLSNYFLFYGHTERPDRIYRSLDCLAIPSLWEACPYTAIEAMAMQIPVVASNVGGIPEIITHRKSGIIVQGKKPEELAKAIVELKQNPGLAKKITRIARKRVVSKFNCNKTIPAVQKIYRKLWRQFKEPVSKLRVNRVGSAGAADGAAKWL
ncbi:MAG: glycosyltransferase family 4 protein [Victivallales bacterium]|nr:glycosyltransferase family 4 protein [Victivallales bacterium]